jgi:osmoprotectant transport system permease protein
MPDSNGTTTNVNTGALQFPVAAVVWFVFTILVFGIGLQTVSLQDQERFPEDVILERTSLDGGAENEYVLNVVSGSFQYGERAEEIIDVPEGTFEPGADTLLPRTIFEAVEAVTQVEVTQTQILVTFEEGADGEAIVRRLRNPVFNYLANERPTMTSELQEDPANTIRYETTDERLTHARFVPELIPPGTTEQYNTREAGLNGSLLAQMLFNSTRNLDALTIEPQRMIATYGDGNVDNITERLTDALNDYYPRASLQPELWVLSVGFDSSVIVDINAVNTGLPLWVFTLLFGLVELGLFFALRNSEEKLIRPLIRAAFVFLAAWSLFGHEPLWDALLSQLFPTSRQLVHPTSTVIQFTAQHLELVIVSSLITIPTGLFLSILVTRESFRELLPLVNNLVNSGQTVPTIAIVAIMAPIIGFGFWPAIVALIAYGLLPVVRNTIAGLETVDGFLKDSASGMGMTPAQVLRQVELPVASSVIMAGIRTSVVVNVGTATLGAFVGSGGLGTPIASGIGMSIDAFIVLGAIPAALLAILIDYILGRVEYVITPRGLQMSN